VKKKVDFISNLDRRMIRNSRRIINDIVKYLHKVIREAKKLHYDNVFLKLTNKIKTTWTIIKRETGYENHNKEPQALKVNNIVITDKGSIANVFNEYFSSIAQSIIKETNN
jgi:hypothetical protein